LQFTVKAFFTERKYKMSKIAVVYWSGTGNTESMADAVLAGVREKGGEVTLFNAVEFEGSMMDSFDAVAFGCPAMGAEELEETEFAPMFEGCIPYFMATVGIGEIISCGILGYLVYLTLKKHAVLIFKI